MQVYEATSAVAKVELQGLERHLGAVEEVVSGGKLIYNHVAVVCQNGDLLDDVVGKSREGIKTTQIGTGDTNVVDPVKVQEPSAELLVSFCMCEVVVI